MRAKGMECRGGGGGRGIGGKVAEGCLLAVESVYVFGGRGLNCYNNKQGSKLGIGEMGPIWWQNM